MPVKVLWKKTSTVSLYCCQFVPLLDAADREIHLLVNRKSVRCSFELLEHRKDPGWRPDHEGVLGLPATEGSLHSMLPLVIHEQAKLVGFDLPEFQA